VAASSDSPLDPQSGRLVDPDVLSERRARRAEQLQEDLRERARRAERSAVELRQRLVEAEAGLATGQRERSALAGRLERERERRTELEALVEAERERYAVDLASAQDVLRAAVERGRATSEARLAEVRRGVARLSAKLASVAADVGRRVAFERAAREVVERELAAEREARAAEADALSHDAAALSARLAAAEVALAQAREGAAADRARLAALEAERAQRRAAGDDERISARAREKSAAAVRAVLEAEIVERGHIENQVRGALRALRGALEQARRERAARAAHDAEVVQLVAHLVQTAHGLRAGFQQELATLAAERDAQHAGERAAFAAELARETAARAAAEQRATDARQALAAELERLRATDGANPIYGALSTGSLVPSADHPALLRPETAEPVDRAPSPAVVVDLSRAAARLRAASEPHLTLVERPGPTVDAADADASPAAEPMEPERRAGVIPAAFLVPPTTRPWLAPALATLADVDAPTAERLFLAALTVQAERVKDAAYAIVLPVAGRHHVNVVRPRGVVVAPDGPGHHQHAEFVLEGTVEALAPLATGGVRRRLPGVIVRGSRRRLRRLLRALRAPVGLPELRAAGARPRPGDVLALLCLGVPAEQVRGADFGVAYVVRDADGRQTRTLVRAEPDGSLTAIPEAPAGFAADATVTVDADGLLGVLAGSLPVSPAGDTQAVVTLQRWLRGAQGLLS